MHAETHICHFRSSSEEVEWERTPQLKFEALQNLLLHLQNLRLCKGIVCDVGKVPHLWSVHLFVFTGHQHCGNANKLQLPARHLLDLQHRRKQLLRYRSQTQRQSCSEQSPEESGPGWQL